MEHDKTEMILQIEKLKAENKKLQEARWCENCVELNRNEMKLIAENERLREENRKLKKLAKEVSSGCGYPYRIYQLARKALKGEG